MGQDIAENLFQSIDTIVKARLANLSYDQTLECEIISDTNAEQGKYLVQYQASLFTALSTDTSYKKGDIVYVQIPQGDFTKDKNIINKKEIEKKENKRLSFANFVKGTNLFSQAVYNHEYSLGITENGVQDRTTTFTFNGPYAGYTKLGIQVAINADLLDIISGDYGLKIELMGYDQSISMYQKDIDEDGNPDEVAYLTNEIDEKIQPYFLLRNEDMIGVNPYNTKGYCIQEKVFDITNKVITQIKISLWQDGNFIASNDASLLSQRIYFTNLSCYLGYSTSDFYNTNIRYYLYTKQGLQYNMLDNPTISRTMQIRRIELLSSDKTTYSQQDIFPTESFTFYWEKYSGTLKQDKNTNETGLIGYESIDGPTNGRVNASSFSTDFQLKESTQQRVSYAVAIVEVGTGTKYITNILNFNNTVYTDSMVGFHDSSGVFYLDNNGYLYINGTTSNGDEEAIVQINGALMGNSTLSNITFIDEIKTSNLKITDNIKINNLQNENIFELRPDGTLNAKVTNYASSGPIARNFQAIKSAIEALGGTYDIV